MLTLEHGRRKTAEDRNSKDKLSTNTKYQYNSNTNTEVQVPTKSWGPPTNGVFCIWAGEKYRGQNINKNKYTNIEVQVEEKDGGHPQLGASANGLEEGGGSNPPVMNILYLLVNSAYNQTEE